MQEERYELTELGRIVGDFTDHFVEQLGEERRHEIFEHVCRELRRGVDRALTVDEFPPPDAHRDSSDGMKEHQV